MDPSIDEQPRYILLSMNNQTGRLLDDREAVGGNAAIFSCELQPQSRNGGLAGKQIDLRRGAKGFSSEKGGRHLTVARGVVGRARGIFLKRACGGQ